MSGNIFVVAAPSGAGKSTLVRALQQKDSNIDISISHTTRIKRDSETDGVDYYFVDKPTFEQMLNSQQFIEHANVYGNLYGTSISSIQKIIEAKRDVVLEIDWQGAYQVKKIFPNAILIYILPPSLKILKQRLISRNTDDKTTIEKRFAQALDDISHAKNFDYAITNDNFNVALHELYCIIQVYRLKADKVLDNFKI